MAALAIGIVGNLTPQLSGKIDFKDDFTKDKKDLKYSVWVF